jgi:hypothetical protein
MTVLSKSLNALVGISFLALGACTEQGPDRALWQGAKDAAQAVGDVFTTTPMPATVDAPDPGDTPYPNLGATQRRPTRPDPQSLASEQAALVAQREAAQRFDAQVRAIDPVLDPASRPPEPAAIAAVVTAPTPVATPVQAVPIVAPQAAPIVASVSPTQTPPTQTPPPFVPPALLPTTVPTLRQVPTASPTPVRAAAGTAWLIGEIGFADGSPLLTPDARRVLRQAVAAAQERGGSVRVTPMALGALSPQDQVLGPRRMAAAAGELESLGLDRSKVLIDPGTYRQARVTVEF